MQAYLEIGRDNWCMLHVPALPGVAYKSPGAAQALCQAGSRVAAELSWLRDRGLGLGMAAAGEATAAAGAAAQPSVAIAGAMRTEAECALGDTEAFCPPFAAPLAADAVASGLAYLAAARDDLLQLVRAQPAGWLDARPRPESRTPREVLHHVADAELFYLARLQPDAAAAAAAWRDAVQADRPEPERLAAIRQRLADALAGLGPDARGRITVHDPHAERWSPAKVLYRAIWHDRHHCRLLRQALTQEP
jgi:uncharacterized damage-inducible protein DinB